MIALIAGMAFAQSTDAVGFVQRPVAGHAVFDLRVGAHNTEGSRPFLCAEVSPTAWVSVESCGTGSGILHHTGEADMAHFRGKLRTLTTGPGRMTGDLLFGVGFAEVQRGIDDAGFLFGEARVEEQIEAAGPEAAMSAKARYWTDAGGRTYISADLTGGLAVIPAAPTVLGVTSPTLPFVAFTLGYGF